MSEKPTPKKKTRARQEKDWIDLENDRDDYKEAYRIVRQAVQGAIQAVQSLGSPIHPAVFARLMWALSESLKESHALAYRGEDIEPEATPQPFCTDCNRFLDKDEEVNGRCLTCDKQVLKDTVSYGMDGSNEKTGTPG